MRTLTEAIEECDRVTALAKHGRIEILLNGKWVKWMAQDPWPRAVACARNGSHVIRVEYIDRSAAEKGNRFPLADWREV